MIQRPQTVFLILAAVLLACTFVFNIATGATVAPGPFTDGVLSMSDHILFPALAGLGILFSVVAIALYQKNQLTFQRLLVLVALFATNGFMVFALMTAVPAAGVGIAPGILTPIGAAIMQLLAIRGIRKDQRTYKSADRIR